jgi:hypothetical protein
MTSTCQYDGKCYRKNPTHFTEYSHPNQYPNGYPGTNPPPSVNDMQPLKLAKKEEVEQFNCDFPDDIFENIIKFLNVYDLNSFKLTSKHFFDLVHTILPSLHWKGICADIGKDINSFVKLILNRDPKKSNVCTHWPDRFFEDFHGIKDILIGKVEMELTPKQWFGLWKDFCVAIKIWTYEFDLPIDEMGTDTISLSTLLAIPIDRKIFNYPILSLQVAEEKMQREELYETDPKVESYENKDAFIAFRSEMEAGLKEFDTFDDEKKEKTVKYVGNFMKLEALFGKHKIHPIYSQKVHYYWDEGEYNQGWMFFYGVTRNGNAVGFHWHVYHNV